MNPLDDIFQDHEELHSIKRDLEELDLIEPLRKSRPARIKKTAARVGRSKKTLQKMKRKSKRGNR